MPHRIVAILLAIIAGFVALPSYGELYDWHGIANKNTIVRITHDRDNIYFSSLAAGITVIDKSSGRQTTLNRGEENLFDNTILDMLIYKDELWATGKYYGVGKIDKSGCQRFYVDSNGESSSQWMQGILVENENSFFVGGLNALYKFDNSVCTAQYRFKELSPMVMVTDIKQNNKGEIYISLYDWLPNANSLYIYEEGQLRPIKNPCARINRICIDSETVWLASDGDGLVKYENGAFTQFNTSNSEIPSNTINDMGIDGSGAIWMAQGNCITRFSNGKFTSYHLKDNGNNEEDSFLSVDADGDNILAGTNRQGAFRLINGEFTPVPLKDNPVFCNQTPSDYVGSAFIDANNSFIMASTDGLNVYKPESNLSEIISVSNMKEVCGSPVNNEIWVRKNDADSCLVRLGVDETVFSQKDIPLSLNEVFNIMCLDATGNLWVATTDGLGCYDGKQWKLYTEAETGINIAGIKCLKFDNNGSLWCGSFGNGLIKFDGANWSNYTTKNSSIPSDFIGAVCIDNNNVVWMNCRHPLYPEYDIYGYGLTSFDGASWNTFNVSNSDICSNNIYSIEADKENRLWLATTGDKGVMSFDGKEWTLYSTDNSGLAFNGVNNITIDYRNDLIYFTHMLGNGVSYAKLTPGQNSIHKAEWKQSYSFVGQPVSVYDINGKTVFHTSNFSGTLPVLSKGVYFIVTQVGTQKIFFP